MRIGPAINFTAIIVLGLLISNYLLFTLWASDYLSWPLFAVQELAWLGLIISLVYYRFLKEEAKAATSITTIQLFSTAVGAAISGTVVNMAGLTYGGIAGAQNAAHWLFIAYFLLPTDCIYYLQKSLFPIL